MASINGLSQKDILDIAKQDPEFQKLVMEVAQQAGAKLVECINTSIGASAHSDVIGEASLGGVAVNGDIADISVNISKGEHHDSLVPELYDGIDDMTSLFDKGYTASNRVYGEWHGKRIGSLTHRDAEGFVESGVRAFTSSGGGGYKVVGSPEISDRFKH